MKALEAEVVDTGQRRDTRGRKIVRAEERAALIAAYRGSGLTQRAFAAREGVKYCTFAAWLGRSRRAAKPTFAEVSVPGGLLGGLVEVALPDGLVVRGADPERVANLVTRLRRC